MNLLREVLEHEVYPALGCTEPAACAYAAAEAASHLCEPVQRVEIRVDPGTFKNGAAVTIPFTHGRKGNLFAAALGAAISDPSERLEILRKASPDHIKLAADLCESGRCRLLCIDDARDFRIEAYVEGQLHSASAVIAAGHSNLVSVERDGREIVRPTAEFFATDAMAYRQVLARTALADILAAGECLDDASIKKIECGIQMNMAIAERGMDVRRTAFQLLRMKEREHVADDIFYRVKLRVAAGVDARMAGVPLPVMTSGGSGNQGILAFLIPFMVGEHANVPRDQILRSIAIAHLLNAYVKCFIGELSVVCGCAVAAGIGAAAAIVYQHVGIDLAKISLAINSVIGDLSGLICDGAKPGCSMKCVTAVDTAIRSGLMAIDDFGLTVEDGLVGTDAEASIRNLGHVSLDGMRQVDPVVLRILQDKT